MEVVAYLTISCQRRCCNIPVRRRCPGSSTPSHRCLSSPSPPSCRAPDDGTLPGAGSTMTCRRPHRHALTVHPGSRTTGLHPARRTTTELRHWRAVQLGPRRAAGTSAECRIHPVRRSSSADVARHRTAAVSPRWSSLTKTGPGPADNQTPWVPHRVDHMTTTTLQRKVSLANLQTDIAIVHGT